LYRCRPYFLCTAEDGLLSAAEQVVGQEAGALGEVLGAEQIGSARLVRLLEKDADALQVGLLLAVQSAAAEGGEGALSAGDVAVDLAEAGDRQQFDKPLQYAER
jgi:hypothetical protein